MSKSKATSKTSVYDMVTDRIVKQLEEGIIPWEKPWICRRDLGGQEGLLDGAYNRITKKPYSLLNQCLLAHTGEYASFKQWSDLGGKIKKGAKSEIVVFWKIIEKTTKDKDGKIIKDDDEKELKTSFAMLRYIPVFHISQVEGVKPSKATKKAEEEREKVRSKQEQIFDQEANKILKDYLDREGIPIIHTLSDQAYYMPSEDSIHLPEIGQFKDTVSYYGTAFHEAIHSTGHKTRLNRLEKMSFFGSESYSKEELVAEIGSCAIINRLGMENKRSFDNNVAYIQSWSKALRDDPKLFVSASGKAEKAMNYMLGIE